MPSDQRVRLVIVVGGAAVVALGTLPLVALSIGSSGLSTDLIFPVCLLLGVAVVAGLTWRQVRYPSSRILATERRTAGSSTAGRYALLLVLAPTFWAAGEAYDAVGPESLALAAACAVSVVGAAVFVTMSERLELQKSERVPENRPVW